MKKGKKWMKWLLSLLSSITEMIVDRHYKCHTAARFFEFDKQEHLMSVFLLQSLFTYILQHSALKF